MEENLTLKKLQLVYNTTTDLGNGYVLVDDNIIFYIDKEKAIESCRSHKQMDFRLIANILVYYSSEDKPEGITEGFYYYTNNKLIDYNFEEKFGFKSNYFYRVFNYDTDEDLFAAEINGIKILISVIHGVIDVIWVDYELKKRGQDDIDFYYNNIDYKIPVLENGKGIIIPIQRCEYGDKLCLSENVFTRLEFKYYMENL